VASAGFGLLDAAGRGGGADGGGIGSIGSEAVPPDSDSEPAIANRPAILPLFDENLMDPVQLQAAGPWTRRRQKTSCC
jgi:hypothetical protein